jgi:hypothetical protein
MSLCSSHSPPVGLKKAPQERRRDTNWLFHKQFGGLTIRLAVSQTDRPYRKVSVTANELEQDTAFVRDYKRERERERERERVLRVGEGRK